MCSLPVSLWPLPALLSDPQFGRNCPQGDRPWGDYSCFTGQAGGQRFINHLPQGTPGQFYSVSVS